LTSPVAGQRTINSESLPAVAAVGWDDLCGAALWTAAETSAATSSATETSANGRRKIATSGSPLVAGRRDADEDSVQGVVSGDGNGLRFDWILSAK
jgi:hypothetical protein